MWYVILLAVCIGGDQLLKWWVTSHLDVGQSAPLLPGIVRLTRLHNTGAAWSSFSGKTGLLAAVTIVLMAAMTVNTARALEAASDPMLLATDLADYLVRRGVPFRKAHELVGKAVAMSISTGTPLNQLSDEQFASISDAYGTDARDVFELTKAFAQRTNPGAPNSGNTRRRIAYWEDILSK